MKLSWFNTSMYTQPIPSMYEYVQYEAMQDIEIEFRDSGSNANTEIYFEVRVTATRPRLHTEGFVHTGLPTQGTSTEDLVNIN